MTSLMGKAGKESQMDRYMRVSLEMARNMAKENINGLIHLIIRAHGGVMSSMVSVSTFGPTGENIQVIGKIT